MLTNLTLPSERSCDIIVLLITLHVLANHNKNVWRFIRYNFKIVCSQRQDSIVSMVTRLLAG
jgi:hypothetical protein